MNKQRLVFICILSMLLSVAAIPVRAQCSICTRTAQQLGERPAKALNKGIIYLAVTPLAIFGVIGYRWWKSEEHE
jgi:NADH:ubiquinone oxidoreductase subunit H